VLEHRLLVLGVVVLGVLGDVAEFARDADALRDFAALLGLQELDLLLELLVSLCGEEYFFQGGLLRKTGANSSRGRPAAASCLGTLAGPCGWI